MDDTPRGRFDGIRWRARYTECHALKRMRVRPSASRVDDFLGACTARRLSIGWHAEVCAQGVWHVCPRRRFGGVIVTKSFRFCTSFSNSFEKELMTSNERFQRVHYRTIINFFIVIDAIDKLQCYRSGCTFIGLKKLFYIPSPLPTNIPLYIYRRD